MCDGDDVCVQPLGHKKPPKSEKYGNVHSKVDSGYNEKRLEEQFDLSKLSACISTSQMHGVIISCMQQNERERSHIVCIAAPKNSIRAVLHVIWLIKCVYVCVLCCWWCRSCRCAIPTNRKFPAVEAKSVCIVIPPRHRFRCGLPAA